MIETLRLLHDSLVEALSDTREVVSVGSLTTLIHPTDPLVWCNQTVACGAVTISEFEACIDGYRVRDRQPFFEFAPDLAPGLEEILCERGAELILRAPVMTCDQAPIASSVAVAAVPGQATEIAELGAIAFDSPALSSGAIDDLRKRIDDGNGLVSVVTHEGRVVSCGQAIGGPRVREVAGIATHPDVRRRGLARAVLVDLLRRHFEAGGELAWLTPGDDGARALYESVGFRTIGTQVAYRL